MNYKIYKIMKRNMETVFALIRLDEDTDIYSVKLSDDLEKLKRIMKEEYDAAYLELAQQELVDKDGLKEDSVFEPNLAYLNDGGCTYWSWEIVRTENV